MRFYRFFFLSFLVGIAAAHSYAQTSTSRPSVKITGEVTRPLTLYADDLAGMKQEEAVYKEKDGKMVNYTGVPLMALLSQSGVTMGKELRGPNLAKYMMVKCLDGYKVVFSLAELDSSFTDRKAILVYQYEGKPLAAAQGPFRLILSGEKIPARSCRQVSEIVVRSIKE